MIRYIAFLPLLLTPLFSQAQLSPEFWVENSASTASLRTGGGKIVSSDALTLDKDRVALITYWEVTRGSEDHDIYKCIDIQTTDFEQISQTCWTVLTPRGRRAIEP